MGHLWDALCRAYEALGFARAAGGDEVFRQLVPARIIEPASKLDSLRVLDEAGRAAVVVSDGHAAAAGLCEGDVAAGAVGGVRRARPAGPGLPGALRRVHPVFRDRHRATGSASPGSPRNGAWSRRSPSGCSPSQAGFPLMV